MLCLSTYVLLPWKPIEYKVTFQCTKGLFEVISQFAVYKTRNKSGNFDIKMFLRTCSTLQKVGILEKDQAE